MTKKQKLIEAIDFFVFNYCYYDPSNKIIFDTITNIDREFRSKFPEEKKLYSGYVQFRNILISRYPSLTSRLTLVSFPENNQIIKKQKVSVFGLSTLKRIDEVKKINHIKNTKKKYAVKECSKTVLVSNENIDRIKKTGQKPNIFVNEIIENI